MAPQRGFKGLASLGGIIVSGSPQTKGAVIQGATSATLDGGGAALTGVILAGDKFTVAGDAQEYEIVTGGVIGESVANEVDTTFTPAVVPAGGWADNAAVTFVNNRIAEITEWSLDHSREPLEGSELGDLTKEYGYGQVSWEGRAVGWFDNSDPQQAEIVSNVNAETPESLGLVLALEAGRFYGITKIRVVNVANPKTGYVRAEFTYAHDGDLAFAD